MASHSEEMHRDTGAVDMTPDTVDCGAIPHTIYVVAWDIPPDITVGERFRIKAGIKCSSGCHLADSDLVILDHEGKQVVVGTFPDTRWPGTAGLYVSEAELEAPASPGLYIWKVKRLPASAGIAHAEGFFDVGIRVVDHPECQVTIKAVDRVTQTPLGGAHVVMHPYRTVADEHGIARIRVAKGAYKLFVSQTNYLTFGLPIEVASDVTARAELDVEPVLERN